MSKHAGTIVGAVLLAGLVVVVIATQKPQDGHHDVVVSIAAASPTPSAAPLVLTESLPSGSATPHPAQASAWDQAIGATAHGTLIAWLVALGILPLFALAGIALHARHRSKLVELDHPPLRQPEYVHRAFDVKALEARRGWLPESFTYSPHMRNDTPELEEAPTPALPLSGSVEDLLSHGRGLAYGWRVDNGELLVDRQVRSLLVGGVQGSGKTSFVALLVAQLVRMNARVMLADPDALNPQGLAYRLAGLGINPEQTAQEPTEIARLVVDAQHELMTRKGQGAHADTRPYVVVVDELPECLRVLNRHDSGQLASALELIGGLSGRKHSVSVVMLGQSWSKAVVGSTAMRNLITSSAVFRMRSDEAKAMTNLRAEYWRAAGPDPLDLEPGMFYAVGIDSGAVLARVPKLPDATHARTHAGAASDRLHSGSTVAPFRLHGGSIAALDGADPEPDRSPNGAEAEPPSAEDWRIAQLFDEGCDIAEIVRQVFNVTSATGSRYQKASRDVQAALRRVRQASR